MKKAEAFTLVHFSLMTMATMAIPLDMVAVLWPSIIAGVVGNATVFIGGNVADNGVKGHFYNQSLDRGEP